jgi:hypothetical protein
VVSSGRSHRLGLSGGLNRSGGESAKGMPKNFWTTAVAEGRIVEVPMIIPESIMAVGERGSGTAFVTERMDALISA